MDPGLVLLYMVCALWLMAITLVCTAVLEVLVMDNFNHDFLPRCLQPLFPRRQDDNPAEETGDQPAAEATTETTDSTGSGDMTIFQILHEFYTRSQVHGAEHHPDSTDSSWLPRPAAAVASKLRTKLTAGLTGPCAIFKKYIYPDSSDEDGTVYFDGLSTLFEEDQQAEDDADTETSDQDAEGNGKPVLVQPHSGDKIRIIPEDTDDFVLL